MLLASEVKAKEEMRAVSVSICNVNKNKPRRFWVSALKLRSEMTERQVISEIEIGARRAANERTVFHFFAFNFQSLRFDVYAIN